jgi:hypothetical protein
MGDCNGPCACYMATANKPDPYRIAREMGVLDEVCSHMKDGRKKKPTPLTG